METLAELIETHREGRSARAIAEAAGVGPETVNRILRGSRKTPTVETVDAIAAALGIARGRARRAAALPPGEPEPWTPPRESVLLNARQRTALDELIRAVVRPDNALEDQTPAGASGQAGKGEKTSADDVEPGAVIAGKAQRGKGEDGKDGVGRR